MCVHCIQWYHWFCKTSIGLYLMASGIYCLKQELTLLTIPPIRVVERETRHSASAHPHRLDLMRCRSHSNSFIPRILHLFGTLCLAHVSLHPKICRLSEECQVLYFQLPWVLSTLMLFSYCSPIIPRAASCLVLGELAYKQIHKNTHQILYNKKVHLTAMAYETSPIFVIQTIIVILISVVVIFINIVIIIIIITITVIPPSTCRPLLHVPSKIHQAPPSIYMLTGCTYARLSIPLSGWLGLQND